MRSIPHRALVWSLLVAAAAPAPRAALAVSEPFTLIVASDPQLPWWRTGHDPTCPGPADPADRWDADSCFGIAGRVTNQAQVTSMNELVSLVGNWPVSPNLTHGGGAIQQPLAVIMNGDLTNFWQSSDVPWYRQFYDPGYEDADPNVLRLPIFPGLGNHDYANNVEMCYRNHCAKEAVDYIRQMIAAGTVDNFFPFAVQSFDPGSLAYSFDLGSYHFVQLHNYPTYEAPSISIASSIDWLREDLVRASGRGKKIVLDMHDYGDHMHQDDPDFLGAIQDQNVVAVFAGHIHADHGYVGDVPGSQIPVFRSGAAEYNTFLAVELGDDYFNVGVIDSHVWSPRYGIIPEVASQDPPALAELGGTLWAVWNGYHDDGIYYASFDGTTWSGQSRITGVSTRDAPALAELGGTLYAVWNGYHDDGIYYASFDGTTWSGQSRISGVATQDAPALASLGNRLVAAWNGYDDDGIYYASFDGTTWSGQSRISRVATRDAPALAAVGNRLVAAWNGYHDDGIFYASFDGASWSGQSRISGVATRDAPALAGLGGTLWAVWNGYHDDGVYYASFDGGAWSAQRTVPFAPETSEGPAVAAFGKLLVTAWIDGDGDIVYAAFSDTAGFLDPHQPDNLKTYAVQPYQPTGHGAYWAPHWPIPGVCSPVAPGLAELGGELVAVWTEVDSVRFATFDGLRWSAPATISGVGTRDRPALAVFDGRLYAVWNGYHDDGIFYASYDGSSWNGQSRISGVATRDAPALGVFGNRLYAAWNGYHDDGIFYAAFDGRSWSGQSRISGVATRDAPALAAFDGKLYAAWNGYHDDGIFYASFDGSSWSGQARIEGVATQDGPALAAYGDRLVAAWNGYHDDGIFYAAFDRSGWEPQQRADPQGLAGYGVINHQAPSLVAWQDKVLLAWTDFYFELGATGDAEPVSGSIGVCPLGFGRLETATYARW
jgi:hypothetical protein